jgi:hypothetical protein
LEVSGDPAPDGNQAVAMGDQDPTFRNGRILNPAPPPVSAWRDRCNELTLLRGEGRPLWDDLEQTYDALRASRGRKDYSPSSADLLALAERLVKTLEREEKPARYDP